MKFEAYWYMGHSGRPEGWEDVTFRKFISVWVRGRSKVRITITRN